ncbi:MAG: DUF262 domain-containing protein [Nocardiopsaceae bacterium]|nr:DUF262 domain-containing protein [Nocardiopsaceae bacterium]
MRAQEISAIDLIQGEKQFQVPLYQRTYSWEQKQLGRLWDDALEQVDTLFDGNRSPHFLGSIVLAPGELSAAGFNRWLVVDGQQRLTSLMLAFCALRDHLASFDGKAADRIHRRCLVNEFKEGRDHYRLLPTQADRQAFLDCVDGNPTAGGADKVGHAYRFFKTKLARANADAEYAQRIESVLCGRLSVVEIIAEKGDNVYRIFKSLNDTGVRLTQTDLLRNYIFMRLPHQGEDVYDRIWFPLQDMLGPENLELLVWLDLVIRGSDKVKQTEISQEQQNRLDEVVDVGGEDALRGELEELSRRGRLLRRILDPEQDTTELRGPLVRLKEWGGQTTYPMTLHLLDLLDRGESTVAEVAEALGYVESFLVRRMLCVVPTNNLNRIFNSAPKELETDRPVPEAVHRYLSGERRYWPSDTELRESIRRRPFYWSGRPGQRLFVLRRLEESYDASEPVDFAKAKLTIEHIMPQTATEEWLERLAEEVTDEEGPQQLHGLLLHTLGNLTLTAENAHLSNHPFHRKQEIFEHSALRMNREIADAPNWGKKQILARADALSDRAARLWPAPLPGGSRLVNDRREWAMLREAMAALPTGSWTTYGDIAELIGSGPQAVGNHIASRPDVANPHRALNSKGRVAPNFRWPDGRTDDPRELLKAEGVVFDDKDRADPAQRLHAAELAALLNLELPDPDAAPSGTEGGLARGASFDEREQRFHALLRENQSPPVATAVTDLLEIWTGLGGALAYGTGTDTSCFPLAWEPQRSPRDLWPVAFYPLSGRVEVVFQHLSRREPFADIDMRRSLLKRLNRIPGVHLAEVKLGLRPSFSMKALTGAGFEPFRETLEWFLDESQGWLERENEM